MKVFVTGDWHLGKIINNYSMIEEQTYVLQEIKEKAVENKIDMIIITGDVYDRAIPPKEAIALFDDFVSICISKLNIKIMLISGNHDSYDRLSFGGSIFQSSGFYIGKKFSNTIDTITINDDFGPINFFLIPFVPYQEVRMLLKDKTINSFHMAYKRMLEATEINKEERNVLITHTFVVSNMTKTEESDSEKTLALGGIDFVDCNLFDGFDYVALGHIHRPQKIEKDIYRYAGSILKYSFSEANNKKSLIQLELSAKNTLTQELIPLSTTRDLVVIKGMYENIIEDTFLIESNKKNYVKIILEDTTEITDIVSKLKVHFPLIMEFKYDKPRRYTVEHGLMSEELAKKIQNSSGKEYEATVLEMFEDFADKTADMVLSSNQKKILNETVTTILKEEQEQ